MELEGFVPNLLQRISDTNSPRGLQDIELLLKVYEKGNQFQFLFRKNFVSISTYIHTYSSDTHVYSIRAKCLDALGLSLE